MRVKILQLKKANTVVDTRAITRATPIATLRGAP